MNTRLAGGRGVRAAVVAAVSVVLFVALQLLPLLITPRFSFSLLRNFYSYDQWGYLAIVRNVADGDSGGVEPDTETGTIHYPRAYYMALGHIARVTGLDPIAVWNVVGITVQLALVAVLALTLVKLSHKIWPGLLAPFVFLIGTFSWTQGTGWFTQLESHAVLWGPFAVLYTVNGESFSLSVAAMSMLGLIWVWFSPQSTRVRTTWTLLACLAIGSLANIQTYSFLAAVYVIAYVTASWALVSARKWVLGGTSIVLVAVVFTLGPAVSENFGQLPTLLFGLMPVIPGLIALAVRTRGLLLAYGGVAVAVALPEVMSTVLGSRSGDPFLTYRVASNSNLGIGIGEAILATAVAFLPLLVIAVIGLVWRSAALIAYSVGFSVAWLLLASNDRWGANAEPYRLWIDCMFFFAVTCLPLLVVALRVSIDSPPSLAFGRNGVRAARPVVAMLVVLAFAVAGASALDWWRFSRDDAAHSLIRSDTERDRRMVDLVVSADITPSAMLLVDPCIDPKILKVNSGVPVAFYHLGMAWPEDMSNIKRVVAGRESGVIEFDAARSGGVRWVLTDDACTIDWASEYGGQLMLEESQPYADGDVHGTVSLWRLKP